MKEKERRQEIVREGKEKKKELYTSIDGLHYTISSKEKSSWKNNNAWDGLRQGVTDLGGGPGLPGPFIYLFIYL